MDDYKSFLELDNKGSVLFVFSDKNNIFVVYEDMEDEVFYMFQLDKQFIVEAISQIVLPKSFIGRKIDWLRWFAPTQQVNKCYSFQGICQVEGVNYKFKIDDSSVLTVVDKEDSFTLDIPADVVKCLPGIKVESFSRKKHIVHVIGLDTKYNEQVYCVVDLDKEICVRRYHLRSDVGDLKVRSVCVDTHEERVYLCGEISRFDEVDDSFLFSTPYVESFLLTKG